MQICPICETENQPTATNCEVCGERLAPAAPGEVLSPEENVGAMLSQNPPIEPAPVATPSVAPPRIEPATAAPLSSVPSDFDTPAAPAPVATPPSAVPDDFDTPAPARGSFVPDPEPPAPARGSFVPDPPAPKPVPRPAPAQRTPAPRPAPVQRPAAPARIVSSGIPSARLVVYVNKQPVHTHPVVNDETLLGRFDPVSGSYPELDLTEFDTDSRTSRKHAYLYRQGGNYYLYPVSNAGTQHNQSLVDMGEKRKLANGDVIILAGALAMKFHIDE